MVFKLADMQLGILDKALPSSSSSRTESSWPESSQWYDPLTTNLCRIKSLIANDTQYNDPRLSPEVICTAIRHGEAQTLKFTGNCTQALSETIATASLVVVHVTWKRWYHNRWTTSALGIDEAVWKAVLEALDVLPGAMELLHNNNGGSLSYSSRIKNANEDDAQHLAYSIPEAGDANQGAIYARQEPRTGRAVVLTLGTASCLAVDRIRDMVLHADAEKVNIFFIVQAWLHEVYRAVEDTRWKLDYDVQELEGLTGYAAFGRPIEPPRPDQLVYDSRLHVRLDYARALAIASMSIRLNCEAFQRHAEDNSRAGSKSTIIGSSAEALNLHEVTSFTIKLARAQFDQVRFLRDRLETQLDVTRALVALRAAKTNLSIAESTRRDSELMRGIAVVTMIFLPATFVATFFSMVFFHVGEEEAVHLLVDSGIWMYAAVTMPLTLGVSIWYFSWSLGGLRLRFMKLP